jgi:hypothetical protein
VSWYPVNIIFEPTFRFVKLFGCHLVALCCPVVPGG